jgi:hypothetical protein
VKLSKVKNIDNHHTHYCHETPHVEAFQFSSSTAIINGKHIITSCNIRPIIRTKFPFKSKQNELQIAKKNAENFINSPFTVFVHTHPGFCMVLVRVRACR